jgi:hypothetical protein
MEGCFEFTKKYRGTNTDTHSAVAESQYGIDLNKACQKQVTVKVQESEKYSKIEQKRAGNR